MTQTLTTYEELKLLASSDNANELTRRLARECLANREAQPVGVMNIGSETCSDYLVAWTKAGAQLGKGVHWLYTAPPAPASEPIFFIEVEGDDWINAGRIPGSTFDFNNLPNGVNKLYAAPPAPANANAVAWEMRYWNSGHNMWGEWERITAEQHAEMSVQHATDNDYEFRVLYDAPAAPAVQDEIDSFADQVIGTKDKIILLPAPMPVPLEGIRVYLNADAIISYLEKQGYIVEVSRE